MNLKQQLADREEETQEERGEDERERDERNPPPPAADPRNYVVTPKMTDIGNGVVLKQTDLDKILMKPCGLTMIRAIATKVWSKEVLAKGTISELDDDVVDTVIGKQYITLA